MAIIDVVKFDGLRSRDWLVYKFPSDTLVFGTRLIVNEGQVAVFVKGGQVCDLFYPGSYILDTDNLPVLFHIFNLPYGGNTPFTAEVYFINTKTKLDIPWGTSDPIQLIDPKYFVKLRIRAFGQMGLKLMDYSLFFRELIGSMNQNDIVSFASLSLSSNILFFISNILYSFISFSFAQKFSDSLIKVTLCPRKVNGH